MIINFNQIDFSKRPNFILRNIDGTAIQNLGHILNPSGRISYNEISQVTFDYPAYDDGVKLEEYDLLSSMRIVDIQNYGQFILQNPSEIDDGVVKKKSCTLYSLEYEFTTKTIYLEEGTYNFWNPLTPDGTILGLILEKMKSWSVGTVSSNLIGKYRTFDVDDDNVYDFIKSKLQETYGCIFEFDTYNRVFNVRSVDDAVETKPVYLSKKNLIKKIDINENTEELVTALDVNGADGVNIRSVNPMGTNTIYNLDYYMNTGYFSDAMVSKWNAWKSNFQSYQQTYFNLVVEQKMQISRYATENAALTELNGDLSGLESKRAVIIQGISMDTKLQSDLNAVNAQISQKQNEIATKQSLLNAIQSTINSITNELKNINNHTGFENFSSQNAFTADEIIILDRYFRTASLTDSTFVESNVLSYATEAITKRDIAAIFNIENATVSSVAYGNDITFYSIRGGNIIESSSALALSAEIIHGTLQVNTDHSLILSLYLNNGTVDSESFPSGTLSMTGTYNAITSTANTLQFRTSSATLYMTQSVTEYQKMAIEWELFEYGMSCLEKMAYPTYSFSVDSSNFLKIADFIDFAQQIELGEKIYLDLSDRVVLPILVAFEIDFDNPTKLELDFGDSFHDNAAEFTLQDLLDDSISMGSSLDYNQYNYSNFVNSGAKTSVAEFMNSAIDTMKNRILSGLNEDIIIDSTGIRCRRYNEETNAYDPEQLWITSNAVMFTGDDWNTAEIGIGKFKDKNLGTIYGVVAPAIVGTILAGSQLVIESEKQDGNVAVFKVDAEGASLHNASFNLYGESGGRIDLGATFGIVGGSDKNKLFKYNDSGQAVGVLTKNNDYYTVIDDVPNNDSPNASFWLDMAGDLYIKGIIDATGGIFRGSLEVGGNTAFRVDGQGNLKIGGTENSPNFSVDANGNLTAKSADINGRVNATALYVNGSNILTNTNSSGQATNSSQIKSNYLDLGNITLNGSSGDIEMAGDIVMGGNITMGGSIILNGNIKWGTDNSPTKVLYARTKLSKPTLSYSSYPSTSTSGWHTTLNATYDIYASYSYDGGSTWTDVIKLQGVDGADGADGADGRDGVDGKDGKDGSDATVTRGNIAKALYNNSYNNGDGIYSYYYGGKYYIAIDASYILAGDIDADHISLTCAYGGFAKGYGNDGTRTTNGAVMYGSNGMSGTVPNAPYFIVTDSGCRMQASDASFYVTGSVVHASSEVSVGSDRRMKNSYDYDIEKLMPFYMSLRPLRFKYNNGTSGRYHMGFLAQEVENSLINNGLSTNDFAGLIKEPVVEVFDDGIDDYRYGLRYGEFVAMNTYMIQQLYKRIDNLELILKQFKGERYGRNE